MRRFPIVLLWILSLCLCSSPALAEELLRPVTPSTRPALPPLAINVAQRTADPTKDPLPFVPGSWTLAVIPDVQYYNDVGSPKYPNQRAMLQWIVTHKTARNVPIAVTLGDITNNDKEAQYENARAAFSVLDGQLPYVMTIGNHDIGKTRRDTKFNDFFKVTQNPLNDPAKGGALGGTMEPGRIENAWYTFTANKLAYLVITIEYRPSDAAVEWAGKIAAEHPDKRAILLTHWYLSTDDKRFQNPKPVRNSNDGEEIWQKLVRHHPNFIFVINGHVLGKQRGYLASKGDKGNTVHQILYNRQGKDDGQLRLLEFLPDNKTVYVKTYSPVTDKWDQDVNNQYILNLFPGENGPASRPATPR